MSPVSDASPVGEAPTRTDLWFPSGGERCHAWVYRPPGVDESTAAERPAGPAVVMAHGLGGTKDMRLDAYAERFAAAGYTCLVFDYRHFGESGGKPRRLLSVRRQLADWESAVAQARRLPGVDPALVVVWGTSFAGGHAITLATRDSRLAAAVAQCPFTDGVASSLAVAPGTSARVTLAAGRDVVRALRGREPLYLPAAAAPGGTAFMTSEDALPGMLGLLPDGTDPADVDLRLTARSALDVLRYAPGRRAAQVGCPLLVALCDPDTVAPNRAAARQVARAPQVEVRTYPVGHFAIYLGEAFEQAVADQLDFLQRHVPVG